MNNFSYEHYTYSVVWSKKNNTCIASVAEFPSIKTHRKSPGRAATAITWVVCDVLVRMRENGETPPVPLWAREKGDSDE
jgi:hypothetical protein